MLEVTESLTRKVADLARLELTDEEVKTYSSQLGRILQYVDQLPETDVEPMSHPTAWAVDLETPMREDLARPSPLSPEGKPRVLESAPEAVDDGYKVPPVL